MNNVLIAGNSDTNKTELMLDYICKNRVNEAVIIIDSNSSTLVSLLSEKGVFVYPDTVDTLDEVDNTIKSLRVVNDYKGSFTFVIQDIEVAGEKRFTYDLAKAIQAKYDDNVSFVMSYETCSTAYIDHVSTLQLFNKFTFDEVFRIDSRGKVLHKKRR